MKLRLRSTATKETIRVETPDSSSLLDLKTLISGKLSSCSSSSPLISPQSITLSLNRKEELTSSSPDDSLQSLGLTSGDLLFYSYTVTLTPPPKIPNSEALADDPVQQMVVDVEKVAPSMKKSRSEAEAPIPNQEIPNSDAGILTDSIDEPSPAPISDRNQESEVEMELKRYPSVPCFLKRVMELEKEEIKGNLGFVIVAVHAVFLESGFVVCNGDGSRLPKDWNLTNTTASIRYTVPDLLGQIQERDIEVAILKYSMVSNYVSVYGSLSGDHSDVYRLCLDISKVVPLLVFLSNSMSKEEENEVFTFWKLVKDGICLPLLIDVCQKNGLPPPPCFARLFTDLKIKILELLPGVDVARLGCTGSEMRYLTSNDELWKKKFVEELGMVNERDVAAVSSWKEKFKRSWLKKKDADKNQRALLENRYGYQRMFMPRYPPFAPQRFPIVGGDYDRFPAIGDLGPMWPGLGYPRLPARRNFSPHCNLGGHSPNFIG